MVNQRQLENLGLSEKEASVYIALLELGSSTMTEIARVANINRTTGYTVLESLSNKGLINFIGETKVQKFVAENPERVISFLENKIKEEKEKVQKAYSLLPELLSIYNLREKPKVKFYEGIERIKEAFEDTLNAKGDILAYAVGTDAFRAAGEEYFRAYFKRRIEHHVKVRAIVPDDPDTLRVIARDKEDLRESIVVPKDKFYFTTETNIYNNKILNVSWKEKFAVVIESKEMADAQKKVFELAWLGAKILQNKS
jgi:HTH-type transcriptional regulator, sugar sensing transcriptional regulator